MHGVVLLDFGKPFLTPGAARHDAPSNLVELWHAAALPHFLNVGSKGATK